MTEFKVGDKVRVNAQGHLYGPSLRSYTTECSPGSTGVVTEAASRSTGNLIVRWDGSDRTSAIRPESLELVDPQTTEPIRVWSEHLADITRAVQIISDADKALKDAALPGTPGYHSDLDFQFPRRVPISIGGVDTGWAIVWDDDSEAWMAEFGA